MRDERVRSAYKPPRWFPWNGGKRWLADDLCRVFQKWPGTGKYVEPFVGGGAVAMVARHVHPEVAMLLSDANPWLASVYSASQKGAIPYPKGTEPEMWRAYSDVDLPELSEIQRAQRFVMCVFTAWGNRWKTEPDGVFTASSCPTKDIWCDPQYLAKRFSQLNKVRFVQPTDIIRNHNVFSLLQEVKAGDLLYLDPPYPDTLGYGTQWWTVGDFIRLSHFARDLSQEGVNVVVSSPDSVGWLFEDWGFTVETVTPPGRGNASRKRDEMLAYYLHDPARLEVVEDHFRLLTPSK